MRPRLIRHLQKAVKNALRPELMVNLESVLAGKKDEVEDFANTNVSVEFPTKLRIKNLFLFAPELLRYDFAAVYFANAQYFQRDVKADREQVKLSIIPGGRSYHGGQVCILMK